MKSFKSVIICLFCLIFLCGCWDKQELEDNTFVILLGIDTAEDNKIIVTITFPLTQTSEVGINEETGINSDKYSIMSVKAPTLAEGLNMFSVKLSSPLALYSVKTLVISEKLAKDDILNQIFSMWSYNQIRSTTAVLISGCTALEFIEARLKNNPIDSVRQEELLLEQINQSSYYKAVQLLDLTINLNTDSRAGITMYGGISKEKSNAKGDSGNGYLAGEVPIKAENKTQICGLAVFKASKMVGTLNSAEAQTYSMLTQSKAAKTLTIADPIDKNSNIVVSILPTGKSKTTCEIKNGNPVFHININLNCTIEYIQSNVDYSNNQNYDILTEHVQKICLEDMQKFITKVQKEYNADILHLGDKLKYHFLTDEDWNKFNWTEKYHTAEINLNVDLNIDRTGLIKP